MTPLLTGLPFVSGGGTPLATVTGTTGSPTVDTSSRPGKTIYKFTGSGSITIGAGGSCEILCVGGGGSGAFSGPFSGTTSVGGSAGGMVTTTTAFLPSGTHTITVGAGGAVALINKYGRAGNGSLIGSTYYAQGGGGAAYIDGTTFSDKTVNMSGTGGFGTTTSQSGHANLNGGLGNSGGIGFYNGTSNNAGGGSGGAGGAGGAASSGTPGAAGAGLANSITGSSVTYAAGSNGGSGAGTANTGNGGGSGVAGGSGIVIVVVG
jgi:hypothetical protein